MSCPASCWQHRINSVVLAAAEADAKAMQESLLVVPG